jgi:hypothetical protein
MAGGGEDSRRGSGTKMTKRSRRIGRTKIESAVRYMGVDIEDARALAESTEV